MLTRTNNSTFKPSIIVAVDKNFGLAKNGNIPWKIREDMNYFQDITTAEYKKGKKNAIIVGHNTWKTLLPNGLNNRINVVISSQFRDRVLPKKDEMKAFSNLRKAVEYCQENSSNIGKTFICGGRQTYIETIQRYDVNEMYLTQIDNNYGCDVKVPILYDGGYKINEMHKFTVCDRSINRTVPITFTHLCKSIKPKCENYEEMQYLNILEDVIKDGQLQMTRNGNTYSKFGKMMEFELSNGFPLLTTKRVFFRGIVEELLFFLRGETNTNILLKKGVKIWEKNTNRNFLDNNELKHYDEWDMGPMYGYQWRHFNQKYYGSHGNYENLGFDQLKYCISLIKNNPASRRIIMTTYNPIQAKQGVLFPCHGLFTQFYVDNDHKLSCMMVQRSGDLICGIPFNIASYALLVNIICDIVNNDSTYTGKKITPGKLIINIGDAHIYEEHRSHAIRQILRKPYKFPELKINKKIMNFEEIKCDDITLQNYDCHAAIDAKMVA